jgi:hypothetical protein
MVPLRRWPTRESIRSWWSDSNSLGATIPLHTLSKPLLKYLYHRQALGIIVDSRTPLSTDKIEVLTTYLEFVPRIASERLFLPTGLSFSLQFQRNLVLDAGARSRPLHI